jgi:hypothetical protein
MTERADVSAACRAVTHGGREHSASGRLGLRCLGAGGGEEVEVEVGEGEWRNVNRSAAICAVQRKFWSDRQQRRVGHVDVAKIQIIIAFASA